MTRITGNGAPTRNTVGEVGQLYEDLNTGDIYECIISSQYSKLHGTIQGGYIWTLKISGDDREDHEVIFSGGASSWNDLTDKPFGTIVETVLVKENVTADCAETFDTWGTKDYDGCPTATVDGLFIEAGKTYLVEWDGVEYTCVAVAGDYGAAIGNMSLKVGAKSELDGFYNVDVKDTGEPFGIFYVSYYSTYTRVYAETDGEHTFTVKRLNEVITPIDDRYLPIGKLGTGQNSEVFNDCVKNTATGNYAHAEGHDTHANGDYSHAENYYTTASGVKSHAEGNNTDATGESSHAEGEGSKASGKCSHAEGSGSEATGFSSHAEGLGTIAASSYQHVQGRKNIADSNNKYAHIVGNGPIASTKRSNCHTLDWDGNAWFAGGIELTSPNGTRYRFTVADDGTLSSVAVTE